MGWTLKYGTKEKTFAEWGFSGLHRRTSNFRPDLVTFTEENVLFDQDPKFAFDEEITIYKSDDDNSSEKTLWFTGRITRARRSGTGGQSESITYEAKGVLSWLDDLIFRQAWKYLTDKTNPDSDKFTVYLSDLVLFQKIINNVSELATIKEQIQEIFDYLISKWTDAVPTVAPKLQLDASRLPEFQAPFAEVSNITCAMALEICLRLCPDSAIWIDYSTADDTNPPTVRIARRGTTEQVTATPGAYLEQVTLEVPDEGEGNGKPVVSVNIHARDDLKVPVVIIEYRQLNSVNGVSAKWITDDIWPVQPEGADLSGFRKLPQVVNLEGTNITYPTETLAVRTIDISSIDWWKLHDKSLAKPNIQNLKIREATRDGSLPYEILPDSGAWSPWMGGAAEEDIVQCYADWDRVETKNGQQVTVEQVRDQLLSVRLMTTNKQSGTYQGQYVGTIGEPVPVGMAKALYEAASETHYEGTIVLEEDECSGSVMVGNVVNLVSSKRPEWETMRAMVQEVEEDIDAGRTTVTVGPPKMLGVNEIMDWLRGLRHSNTGAWSSRLTGLSYGSGPLQMASRAHKETLSGAKQTRERLVLMRPDSQTQTPQTLTAKIILDIAQCHGKVLQIQELAVCDNGVTKYMLALCSEIYTTPIAQQG